MCYSKKACSLLLLFEFQNGALAISTQTLSIAKCDTRSHGMHRMDDASAPLTLAPEQFEPYYGAAYFGALFQDKTALVHNASCHQRLSKTELTFKMVQHSGLTSRLISS